MVDQARPPKQSKGIAQVGQVPPQITTGSIADAQFFDQVRILQPSLLQILNGFWMAVELQSVKSRSFLKQFGVRNNSDIPLQVGEAFAEGQMV